MIAPLDMDVAHEVHNYLRSKGINLRINQKCAEIGDGFVLLSDGSKVDADFVILSIGVAPDTGFLSGSGIKTGKRGEILVNEYLETSVPDVYAGDAVTVSNLVTKAKGVIALAGPANKQGADPGGYPVREASAL